MSGGRKVAPDDGAPPLPAEIRKAHDQGKLVLFCGAGVSSDAGYPLFPGLVNDIYASLPGHVRDARETKALENKEYDRALHILESKLSNNQVRAATIERLSRKPHTLAMHEALLRIAKQRDGVHLVTTNFDNLFAEALQILRYASTEVDAAPKLPVPKSKKWNSVVHLHGRIDTRSDPDGRRLVLTSADFGSAYLTEGWASRFVSELIRRYTLLFVGYQANDAVMRYILDALDADRRLDEHVYRPFAFASVAPGGTEAEQLAEWQAKSVTPIPYPTAGHSHRVLRQCLTRWASDWSDGREGKTSIVEGLASSQPDLPPPEKERLLWALSDPSGVPARQLTAKDDAGVLIPRAPITWLGDFATAGLLEARSDEHASGITDRFLGAPSAQHGIPLSERGWQFLVWLRAHLPSIELFRQVAAVSGAVHPGVALELRRAAVEQTLTSGKADLAEAWSIITSSAIVLSPSHEMPFLAVNAMCKAIARWPEAPWIDHEVEYALTPFLRMHDPEKNWRYEEAFGLKEADRTTRRYLSADIVLRCEDSVDLIAETLSGRDLLLSRLASRVNALLQRALDLQALMTSIDYSSSVLPKIQGLSQNYRRRSWAILLDLAWASFLACQDHSPSDASALYDAWARSSHPAHRRLQVRAAEESRVLTSAQRLAALLRTP